MFALENILALGAFTIPDSLEEDAFAIEPKIDVVLFVLVIPAEDPGTVLKIGALLTEVAITVGVELKRVTADVFPPLLVAVEVELAPKIG